MNITKNKDRKESGMENELLEVKDKLILEESTINPSSFSINVSFFKF